MPVRCECDQWYSDKTGVEACTRNGHGKGLDAWNAKRKLMNSLETIINVECEECQEKIRARIIRDDEGDITVVVNPHVCPVDAPEEIEQGVAA